MRTVNMQEAEEPPLRTGFLAGQGHVPANFDALNSEELADLFQGAS